MDAKGLRIAHDDPSHPVCTICGQQTEDPRKGCCWTCHASELLPADYQEQEVYQYDRIWHHPNATERPPTGKAILDATPLRFSQIVLPKGLKLPRGA